MNTLALSAADIAVIVFSLAIVVVLGLAISRKQGKTAGDYFLAQGRLPWWIIGSAFVSTSVSSEQIVGTIGQAYETGMPIANWEWWSLPPYALMMLIFIPVYLKSRITTVPDLISRRFNPLCGSIYSYVMLLAYIFVFLVPVLYGGSLTFSDLTGVKFEYILWGLVFLVSIYTVKGGLISVMWTDALQCLMLVGGGLLLYFLALDHIPGGWGAMVEANPDRFHLYRPADDPIAPFAGLIAGTFGIFIFYQATNQMMVQRVLGARSHWDGVMGIVFAGFINILRPLVTCFLGFIVFHWIHELNHPPALEKNDLAFPFALRNFAPSWGLRGVVLAGFLAAVMSTISALANTVSTIFSMDVYKRFIRKEAEDSELIFVGRFVTFSAIVLAALFAPFVPRLGGIFQYFQTGATYVSTPFVPVIALGILWRRTTTQGALAGLLGGIVLQIAVAIGLPKLGYPLHWLYLAAIAEVLTFAVVVIVSLLTAPPAESQWKPFLWRPALVREFLGNAPGRAWYAQPFLWSGLFAVIWIMIYYWFW